ncbi:MAG: NAD(P)/FAD-dependent oxidoreductase [Oligoflexia bacterium]|nr:NAD(P)/FAD-dependent oxidoreductase [Oligoflexia bacterium]
MKIAIIGAGLTGLVAGYRLSQKGHKVTIFEKSADIGGLMGGFKIGKTSLEKAYHHIFSTDSYIIDLAKELGVYDKLTWHEEKTALYFDKEMYAFMGAMDLLKFKPLDFVSKVRLGLVKIWLQMDNNWQKYENVLAYEWMEKWCGQRAYQVIWKPLLKGKFHDKYKEVSMAWLWARIHTRGNSAKLGYFEGGFRIIADELASRIKDKRGTIKVNSEVDFKKIEKDFDKILYTGASKGVEYLGAICVVFSSKQSLSKYYWHNINDVKSPFLAFIQHTNLINKKSYGGRHVYYLGTYIPNEGGLMAKTDLEIKKLFFDYLKTVFPKFDKKQIEQDWVFKFKNAQHIVSKKYKVESYKVKKNVYQANFAMIYPEDRGTNFAVREGNKVAEMIISKK